MSLAKRLMLWVSMDYATYGLTVSANVVVGAPPIAAWMIGKPWPEVKPWLVKRRARIVALPSGRRRVRPK